MANQTTVFLYISRLGVAVLPCLKRILTRQWWYAKGVSYLAVIFLWREADIPWISSARRWSQLQWIDKESDSTPFAPRHLALRKDCLVSLLVWRYLYMYFFFCWGGLFCLYYDRTIESDRNWVEERDGEGWGNYIRSPGLWYEAFAHWATVPPCLMILVMPKTWSGCTIPGLKVSPQLFVNKLSVSGLWFSWAAKYALYLWT